MRLVLLPALVLLLSTADHDGDGLFSTFEDLRAHYQTANSEDIDVDDDGQPDGFELILSGGQLAAPGVLPWRPAAYVSIHRVPSDPDNVRVGIHVTPTPPRLRAYEVALLSDPVGEPLKLVSAGLLSGFVTRDTTARWDGHTMQTLELSIPVADIGVQGYAVTFAGEFSDGITWDGYRFGAEVTILPPDEDGAIFGLSRILTSSAGAWQAGDKATAVPADPPGPVYTDHEVCEVVEVVTGSGPPLNPGTVLRTAIGASCVDTDFKCSWQRCAENPVYPYSYVTIDIWSLLGN